MTFRLIPIDDLNLFSEKCPHLFSENTKKITVTPSTNITSKRSFSTFLQIMDDEEGLLRSVEDFRTVTTLLINLNYLVN